MVPQSCPSPVILATGYSDVASSEMAGAVGIRDFIMKPLNMKVMATRILAVIPSIPDEKGPGPPAASPQPAKEGRAADGVTPRA